MLKQHNVIYCNKARPAYCSSDFVVSLHISKFAKIQGTFTPSESEKDRRTSKKRSKKKIQTSKKIFGFAFTRWEQVLTFSIRINDLKYNDLKYIVDKRSDILHQSIYVCLCIFGEKIVQFMAIHTGLQRTSNLKQRRPSLPTNFCSI